MLIEFKTFAKKWAERRKGEKNYKEDSGLKTLRVCRECYTFYYKNSWHFEKPDDVESYRKNSRVSIDFTQCPACLEQELATYDMESDLMWRRV